MSDAARYCTRCGNQLEPNHRFCGKCGHSVGEGLDGAEAAAAGSGGGSGATGSVAADAATGSVAADATPAAAGAVKGTQASASGEVVLGVVPHLQRRKGVFGYEGIILVVTTERLVFAVPSAQMLREAAQQAAQEAKQHGKGMLGQMWATMSSGMGYYQRYYQMTPGQILAENKQSTMLPLAQVRSVRFRNRSGDDNAQDELIINASGGRTILRQRNMDIRGLRELLRRVVGDVK